MKGKIVIIDDEQQFRENTARLLRNRHYTCLTASNGVDGIELVHNEQPDIILCDIVMPGIDGIEVLDRLSRQRVQSSIIMITAHGSMETAIEALRKGAHDYILKPIYLEDLLQKIKSILERKELMQEVQALRRELSRGSSLFEMVGASPGIKGVVEMIKRVAATRTPVFIRGETGTGKELVARSIHMHGDPPGKQFLAVNCASIPEQLMESELFGHAKGSFTDALEDRKGYFEQADGGTLFLDEISEMSLSMQAKLLRVTEQNEIQPLGVTKPIPVNVRIVSSTNRSLEELKKEVHFRQDLLYRIRVVEIHIPPLRERREDIPILLEYFVRNLSAEMNRTCEGFDNQALRMLMAYHWPGNIRELKNVIERALIVSKGPIILGEDLPVEFGGVDSAAPGSDELKTALRSYEREHIRQVLRECKGHREQTAAKLGIDRKTLYRKITEYEIFLPDEAISGD